MAMVLRPGFLVDVAISSRELIERLEAALAAGPMQIKRTRVPGGGEEPGTRSVEHLVLTVPDAQQHFWSPWLTIELSPGDAGTHLRATFSPHPSVWTGFAFGYLTMTVVLVASLVIASTAWIVPEGGQLWILWISAASAIVITGMWGASQLGQRFASAQMGELRRELDRALDGCRAGS